MVPWVAEAEIEDYLRIYIVHFTARLLQFLHNPLQSSVLTFHRKLKQFLKAVFIIKNVSLANCSTLAEINSSPVKEKK